MKIKRESLDILISKIRDWYPFVRITGKYKLCRYFQGTNASQHNYLGEVKEAWVWNWLYVAPLCLTPCAQCPVDSVFGTNNVLKRWSAIKNNEWTTG